MSEQHPYLRKTKIKSTDNSVSVTLDKCTDTYDIQVTPQEPAPEITVTNVNGIITITGSNGVPVSFPRGGTSTTNPDGSITITNADGTTVTIPADTDDQTASEVAFTPVGTISATDVQGALAELDADVVALATLVAALPADTDDQTASEVAFTPVAANGTSIAILSTDTQGAIAELATAIKSAEIGNEADFLLKEDVINKVQDLSTPNATTYPSTQAVVDAINNIDSDNIEITPIAADATHVGIAGTTTQLALGQIATELKTAQDKPQIFAKVGGVQTTNNVSHTEAETAVRTGAVVIGATTAPQNGQTILDITGDFEVGQTTLTSGATTKDGVLYSHNYGTQNTFTGYNTGNRTLTGINNSFYGFNVAAALTSGTQNSGFGTGALSSITTGVNNVSSGYLSLSNLTTGGYNIAIGSYAMPLANGSSNVSIGYSSLSSSLTGSGNVAIGDNAMFSELGNNNVGIGNQSMYYSTNGQNNTALGNFSARIFTNQTLCTSLGAFTNYLRDNITNSTAVGANANNNASNQVVLGNPSTTEVRSSGSFFGAAFTVVSDKRVKENIREVSDEIIKAIQDKSWQTPKMYFNILTEKEEIGIIAQDVPDILRGYVVINSGKVVDKKATQKKFNANGYEDFSDYIKQREFSEKEYLLEFKQNANIKKPLQIKKLKSYSKYSKDKEFNADEIYFEDFLSVDYTKLLFLQNSYR